MITTINNILLQINIEVTFKLNSLTDKQTYRGRIIGIGGYDIACVYHDVVAPHNNMESNVAQMEPAALTYLILKCDDGTPKVVYIFFKRRYVCGEFPLCNIFTDFCQPRA